LARLPTGTSPALTMLRGWDGVMSANSPAAALFAVWYYRHLNPALAAWAASPAAASLIVPIDSLSVLDLIDAHRGELNALMESSLADAWAETRTLLGNDPAKWRWGTLHQIAFRHPLLDRFGKSMAAKVSLPKFPRGGDGNTPNATSFDGAGFSVTAGASWRMVLDVGRWDQAQMTNAPGQSGDPRSPFYSNLLEGWATDKSFPLLYSRAAIEPHVVMVIRLMPE
jgi:penicillin amidase